MAALATLAVAAISFVRAVSGPSNTGLGIRSVEWLKDNGGAGLVNSIENAYYSLTAPATGGAPLAALPHVGVAGTSTAATAPAARRAFFYRPPRIRPVIHPALPGEGVWHATRVHEARYSPLLETTFRPDPNYPRMVAGVAWLDARRVSVFLYPGRLEPTVPLVRGPMEVPPSRRGKLLATFNSGFKLKDSHGGFALHGQTYAPMRDGVATFVRYANGRIDIVAWHGGSRVGRNIAFARQNLPLIVNHGVPNPNLSDGPEWGATLGNAVRVWRSGIGVTARGDLLYAAANYQTVGSLARILMRAGAVRAMELDINSYWVSFNGYAHPGARGASSLLPSMARDATRYLSPDDRDFFAVYSLR